MLLKWQWAKGDMGLPLPLEERQACRSLIWGAASLPLLQGGAASSVPVFRQCHLSSMAAPQIKERQAQDTFYSLLLLSCGHSSFRCHTPLSPSRPSHKSFSCLVVVEMSSGSSSSRGRGKRVRKGHPIMWEGSLGPDSFEEPIEQFLLESKSDFTHERPLRSYDNCTED
jgi:hypothetical protein